jgi:hypothetical protein
VTRVLLAKAKMCPKGQGTNCKFAPARGFLSPDNYVQNPFGSQNYNRYSYVLNNPLKYIDPSGELPFLATLAIVIAGNYAIGWLDNVINKGMSAKEAFKNTNFIIGVDFNPCWRGSVTRVYLFSIVLGPGLCGTGLQL